MAIFLKNYLLVVLGILALATNVLSAINVVFVAKIENVDVGGRVPKYSTIDDNKADAVLRGVPEWSSGEFRASVGRRANTINVEANQKYPNKNAANTAVQNIQYQVSRNLRQLREQEEQEQGGDC